MLRESKASNTFFTDNDAFLAVAAKPKAAHMHDDDAAAVSFADAQLPACVDEVDDSALVAPLPVQTQQPTETPTTDAPATGVHSTQQDAAHLQEKLWEMTFLYKVRLEECLIFAPS